MKFSIVTPSFNQGQYIEQTIKSVLDQNYPDLEYFVLDGGSTDNTVDIIKKYGRFIKWRSRRDKGQVAAINEGLNKSTGDIIAYVNSDDYYLPGSFQAVADYFAAHPDTLWLYGDCAVTNPKLKWTFFLKKLWPVHKYQFALKIFNTINQPAVFLRKSLVKKVGLLNPAYHYAFDYDYWLRCLQHSLPAKIPNNLTVFRVHPSSLGSTSFHRQFSEDLEIIQNYSRNPLIILVHLIGSLTVKLVYNLLK